MPDYKFLLQASKITEMGIIIATAVIVLWGWHLSYILISVQLSATNPWMYIHILIQSYLYTGLFITAHDAMHGTISGSGKINAFFGYLSTILFAGLWYPRLKRNHFLHHQDPASEHDPDFYTKSQNFFRWWAVFMWRYLTWGQILFMAVAFNILIRLPGLNEGRVILFWVLPAILGTLQLFWVGVYWPHRMPHEPHMGPYKARTQKKNHPWALLSCYFFGYHFEHHKNPGISWWKLYRTKNN